MLRSAFFFWGEGEGRVFKASNRLEERTPDPTELRTTFFELQPAYDPIESTSRTVATARGQQ